MLPTGIGWTKLPVEPVYGPGWTSWRRMREGAGAGVFDRKHQAVLNRSVGPATWIGAGVSCRGGLTRQTGQLDARSRPIRGLPPGIVSGSPGELAAAWRGALLARGTLTPPGRTAALEIACPSPETAVALVGAARRLGVPAKARESRGTDDDTAAATDVSPA